MGKNFLLVDLLLLSVVPFMQAIPYVRSPLFAIDSFVHPSYSPEPSITPAAPPHTNRSFSSPMPYSSTLPHLFFSSPLSVSYFSHCFSSFSGQAPLKPNAREEESSFLPMQATALLHLHRPQLILSLSHRGESERGGGFPIWVETFSS